MKNEHSLNVHVSRYHNAGSVPSAVPCPVCRKTYSNQYSLRTHMHIQAQMLSKGVSFNIPTLFEPKSPSPPKPLFLCAKACLLSSFGKFFVLQHKDQLFLLGEKKRGRRPRLPVPETAAAPSAPFASATPSSASAPAPIPPQPLSLEAPQANPTPPQPSSKAPQAKDSILDLSAPKTN